MSTARMLRQMAIATLALSLLTACNEDPEGGAQAGGQSKPPTEVGVITVEPAPLALTQVLPGRLESTQVAEVRARASGIVLERNFREGSMVEAGQVLFRIDPAPMQAALSSAEASLAKAEANLTQARITAERYAPLVESNAVSRQEYDAAVAAEAAAKADVAAAKSAIEVAQLNLDYTDVKSPISGRVGRALVTVGALVGQGEATPMATVQQFDPIYANLTQSSDDLLRLRHALAEGQLQDRDEAEATVRLVTADGRHYPHTGTLLFTDMTVDPSTSAVTLRAEFPNPDGFLLPGMYVRAELEQGVDEDAITIPQQALQRSNQGAFVMIVNEDGKIESRSVTVDRADENRWVITQGLGKGDVVVVEGLQKVQPGVVVNPTPWKERGGDLATKEQAADPAFADVVSEQDSTRKN